MTSIPLLHAYSVALKLYNTPVLIHSTAGTDPSMSVNQDRGMHMFWQTVRLAAVGKTRRSLCTVQ